MYTKTPYGINTGCSYRGGGQERENRRMSGAGDNIMDARQEKATNPNLPRAARRCVLWTGRGMSATDSLCAGDAVPVHTGSAATTILTYIVSNTCSVSPHTESNITDTTENGEVHYASLGTVQGQR